MIMTRISWRRSRLIAIVWRWPPGEPDDRVVQPRKVDAEAIEELDRALAHLAVIELRHDAEEPGLELAAEKHVLGHVEGVHQAEPLVQASDAGRVRIARRTHPKGGPFHLHVAGVGRLGAGDRLDECRLSGPVVADQSQHLATVDVEGDRIDRFETAVALVEADDPHEDVGRAGPQFTQCQLAPDTLVCLPESVACLRPITCSPCQVRPEFPVSAVPPRNDSLQISHFFTVASAPIQRKRRA